MAKKESRVNLANRRLILAACLAALAAGSAFSDYAPASPKIVSSRLNAMGGPNPALTHRGADTFSTNPAAFAFEERVMRIIGLEAEVSGPFPDAISIASAAKSGGTDGMAEAAIGAVRNNGGIYFAADLTGPLSLAYVSKNFGVGIFNRTCASVDVASLASESAAAGEELQLVAGVGVKVLETRHHELALGMQGKLYIQGDALVSGTLVSLALALLNFSLESLPANSAIGAGVDLGLLWRIAKSLSVGVVCKDALTAVFYGEHDSLSGLLNSGQAFTESAILDPDLQIGVAWQPRIPDSWPALSSLALAAGMSDLLNIADITARNPVLNVTFGAEFLLFNVLALRLGLYETYPALGVGINVKNIFQLDLACYGRELGYEPGERPVFNMALGIGFGF